MNASWLDRNRHLVFISLLLVALGGAVFFYFNRAAPAPLELTPPSRAIASPTPPSATPTRAVVRVYVSGAVLNPEVYFLPPGSIMKDAIQAAGGFTLEADRESINLALELKDQQHVHVPRHGEPGGQLPNHNQPDQNGGAGGGPGGLINLNTATGEQLETLPGVGPAMAQRIIDYREKNGGFSKVEQLTEVSGIGPATFLKIKDLVTVE